MASKSLVSTIEVNVNEGEHNQLMHSTFTIQGSRKGVGLLLLQMQGGEGRSLVPVIMDVSEAKDLRAALDSAISHAEAERKRHGDP